VEALRLALLIASDLVELGGMLALQQISALNLSTTTAQLKKRGRLLRDALQRLDASVND
jgi:hypothetical protein